MAKILDKNGTPLRVGDKVVWYDPQIECRDTSRVWRIESLSDDMALISDGYSESEVLLSEIIKPIIAPIDGKNVCSDWIEDCFDYSSCSFTERKSEHRYLGFKDDVPVYCHYTFGANVLVWQMIGDAKDCDIENAKSSLMDTLKEYDDANPELLQYFEIEGNTIYQHFYWNPDER